MAACNRDQKEKGGGGRCDGPPNETAGIVIVVVAFIASASLVAGRVRRPRVLSLLHHHRPVVLSSLPSGYIFWCFNFVSSVSSSLFWSALSVAFDCCSVRLSEVTIPFLSSQFYCSFFVWVTHKKEKRRRRSCWISQKSRSLALRVPLLTCLPPLCCSVVAFSLLWQTDLVESRLFGIIC